MSQPQRLPYPGLRAYSRDETDLFFGREDCVNEMVDRLAAHHFLAVLGASGSGKSSLVRTGLLDALELGLHAEAGPNWLIADCHPGDNPVRNLAVALLTAKGAGTADSMEVDVLEAFLGRGALSVVEWINDGNLSPRQNLLILVDQFEELFRYGDYTGREAAEAFVALLIGSAGSGASVSVVITMRSEYLGACSLIPSLAEYINRSLYLTRRMTREECRSAIEGPAGVIGFEIEPQLVARLLNDLEAFAPWDADRQSSQIERLSRQADQLPLMQHVLNRLWLTADKSNDDEPLCLRLAGYLALGQLQGALDQHGAEVMKSLGAELAPVVEAVFRGLISGASLATAVRRPARLSELTALANGNTSAVRTVVDTFRAPGCNFLRPPTSEPLSDDTLIDISHESLIRQWSTLSEWLQKEAQDGEYWHSLITAAERHSRKQGDVLTGTALNIAVEWWDRAQPSVAWTQRHRGQYELVKSFLAESREQASRKLALERRRVHIIQGVFATALALVSSIALYVWHINTNLSNYTNKAAQFVAQLSEVSDEIRSSNVIGFMKYSEELFEPTKEFSDYTLKDAEDALSQEGLILFHYTYAGRLHDTGETQRALEEFKAAYDLGKSYLSGLNDIRDASHLKVVSVFFNIVSEYSSYLMDVGNYAEAEKILDFSAQNVESRIRLDEVPQDAAHAQLFDALAGVQSATSRAYGESPESKKSRERYDLAYSAALRAFELEKKAAGLSQRNVRYQRSVLASERKVQHAANDLADTIGTSDPTRQTALRRDAKEHGDTACALSKKQVASDPFAVGSYPTYASCIDEEASAAARAGEFDKADKLLDEGFRSIRPILNADPDRQSIQSAQLQLLDASYRVEERRSSQVTAENLRRGTELRKRWLLIVSNKKTLPVDMYAVDNVYNSLTRITGTEEDLDKRRNEYREMRDALSASVKAFPGARKYQREWADLSYHVAELLLLHDDSSAEALSLYDDAIKHFSLSGIFDKDQKPDEANANACGAFRGEIGLDVRLKRPEDALKLYREMRARCDPMLQAYDWDFMLREMLVAASASLGSSLFEQGQYSDALPELQYASHWSGGDATRYLSQSYRSGLGVPQNGKYADELLDLARNQTTEQLRVPLNFRDLNDEVKIYLHQWPTDYPYKGIDDQARWWKEMRGREFSTEVLDYIQRVHKYAADHNYSFPEVLVGVWSREKKQLPPSIHSAKEAAHYTANPQISHDSDGVALRGYDPVAYFEERKPSVGSTGIFSIWHNAVWLFDSPQHRDRFNLAPERYAPAFGGYCAECMAQGHKVHGDPNVWVVYKGVLYLHMNTALHDFWIKDPDARITLAKAEWEKLRDIPVSDSDMREEKPSAEKKEEALKDMASAKAASDAKQFPQALALLNMAVDAQSHAGRDDALKEQVAEALGVLSFDAVLSGDDKVSLEAAEQALALDEHLDWVEGNRAHALMFLGRLDEARSVYRRERGSKVNDGTFEASVRDDYVALRKAGRNHPLMDEILKFYATEANTRAGT
jgi:tetratricopeptide (TPR) repeat protein